MIIEKKASKVEKKADTILKARETNAKKSASIAQKKPRQAQDKEGHRELHKPYAYLRGEEIGKPGEDSRKKKKQLKLT
jgi:hypothetical protein